MKKGKAKDEIHKPNPPMPKAGPTTDAECFHYKGKVSERGTASCPWHP